VTQRRITPFGETAVATAPRVQFARKRTPPAALPESAGCWTDGRLRNLPVMIGNMLAAAACTDDMFGEVQLVVAKEADRRRRAAATA